MLQIRQNRVLMLQLNFGVTIKNHMLYAAHQKDNFLVDVIPVFLVDTIKTIKKLLCAFLNTLVSKLVTLIDRSTVFG